MKLAEVRQVARDARRRLRQAFDDGREMSLEPTARPGGQGFTLRFRPAVLARRLYEEARAIAGRPLDVIPPLGRRGARPRPRVIHLIASMDLGGSQKLVLDIIRGLAGDYDAEIITRSIYPRIRFADFKPVAAETRAALEAAVAGPRPALVHIHHWGDSSWLDEVMTVIATRFPGVPVVQNENSATPTWHHPAVRHYVYVSRFLRSLQRTPGEPKLVIYPGVDVGDYRPPREPARDETIGLVYRLEDDKLARDTIEVLIAIVRRRPRARVVLVGDGTNFRHYVACTRTAGVREHFHFTGFVPYADLPRVYDRFALFCAPVHAESYGLVVPYAMAKNIPVCGYRVGALPEILGHDTTLADSPDELVEIASALLADPARRAALGDAGRERVRAHFSLDAMLASYRLLYRELATP